MSYKIGQSYMLSNADHYKSYKSQNPSTKKNPTIVKPHVRSTIQGQARYRNSPSKNSKIYSIFLEDRFKGFGLDSDSTDGSSYTTILDEYPNDHFDTLKPVSKDIPDTVPEDITFNIVNRSHNHAVNSYVKSVQGRRDIRTRRRHMKNSKSNSNAKGEFSLIKHNH